MNFLSFILYYLYLFAKYRLRRKKISRYFDLYKQILKSKPLYICEIGVYTGERAYEILKLASLLNKNKIFYWGFDLYEDVPSNIISKEFSKYPHSKHKINKLLSSIKNVDVNLIKGNTTDTLKKLEHEIKFDFVFLDGGHLISTIENDFNNIKKNLKTKSVVIFDDYYHSNKNIIKQFGCNFIIKTIDKKKYDIKIMKKINYFKDSKFGAFGISFLKVLVK